MRWGRAYNLQFVYSLDRRCCGRHVPFACPVVTFFWFEDLHGKLVALCWEADSIRPEIEEAKAFLAGVNAKDSATIDRNR